MFVFIGGVGPEATSTAVADQACPACGRSALQERRIDQVLSLFFVPLMTVHKGQSYRVCTECGWDSRADASILAASESAQQLGQQPSSSTGSHSRSVCQHCGNPVQHNFVFCPFCGSSLV